MDSDLTVVDDRQAQEQILRGLGTHRHLRSAQSLFHLGSGHAKADRAHRLPWHDQELRAVRCEGSRLFSREPALEVGKEVHAGGRGGHNAYHWESAVLGEMKSLAEARGIALVLVHHTNRSTPDDPLDRVSGTNAMTGVPSGIWILHRERASSDGRLYVTGRAVEEQQIDLSFNPHAGGWFAKDPWVGRMPL